MPNYDQGEPSFESRLGDYNDVPARIAEFYAKYPDGSLQPANPDEPFRIEKIGERYYIVVVAAAYRTPDDKRPGIGMAYEQWPGKTSYTRDSELQNAETSAWGRAIIAMGGASAKRGIASREEVRNRKADNAPVHWDDIEQDALIAGWEAEISDADTEEALKDVGWRLLVGKTSRELSPASYERLKAIGQAKVRAMQVLAAANPGDAVGATPSDIGEAA